jgi:PAS domain S-box-containing protein
MPPLDDGGRLSASTELEALVTAFPDVGFIIDAEGRYVQVLSGPESERLLYDDPRELLGSRIPEVFDDEMAETFMSNIDAAIDSGALQSFEYTLDLPDGQRWFEARVMPVGDVSGEADLETEYVVYVARDVTEREERRREIARQRGYMRQMLDSLDDVFYALDRGATSSTGTAPSRPCRDIARTNCRRVRSTTSSGSVPGSDSRRSSPRYSRRGRPGASPKSRRKQGRISPTSSSPASSTTRAVRIWSSASVAT